jgi:hypothetical protein
MLSLAVAKPVNASSLFSRNFQVNDVQIQWSHDTSVCQCCSALE